MKKLFQGNISRFMIESLLIIFSVLFALFINRLAENSKLNRQKEVALERIELELIHNKRVLTDWIEVHTIARENLEKLTNNPNDSLWLEFRKHKYFNAALLTNNRSLADEAITSTSWQTAISTQIISEFDYKLVEILTEIYSLNDVIITKTFPSIIDVYFDKETQDLNNLETTIWQLNLLFQELLGQENLLLNAINSQLAEIQNK